MDCRNRVYYLKKPSVFFEGEKKLPAKGHVVIEASAGTGKTFTIAKLFVEFIYQGIPAEKCLFITFTNKSTEEMQERLRSEVESLVKAFDKENIKEDDNNNEDDKEIDNIKLETKKPDKLKDASGSDLYWVFDEEHQNYIRKAADNFSKVSICTIDALTHRMLQEYGDLTAISPNATVSNNPPKDEAFRRFMRLDVVNDPILRAIVVAYSNYEKTEDHKLESGKDDNSHCFKNALCDAYGLGVLETPGFSDVLENSDVLDNKTDKIPKTIEAYREEMIENLKSIRRKYFAENSNSGAQDFKNRISEAYSNSSKCVEAYFVFCDPAWNDKNDKNDLWLKISKQFSELTLKKNKPEDDNIRRVIDLTLPKAYFLAKYALPKFAKRMEEVKREVGLFEHNDYTKQLAHDISNEALRNKFRTLWRVAVVDEFQDTSKEQWTIFKTAFISDDRRWREGDARLFVVGDPKQAIYGFRGGDVEMFNNAVDLVKDVKIDGIEPCSNNEASLDCNYRASKGVIVACNNIFSQDVFKDCFDFEDVKFAHDDWHLYLNRSDEQANNDVPSVLCGNISSDRIAEEIECLLRDGRVKKGSDSCKNIQKIYVLGKSHSSFDELRVSLGMRGIEFIDSKNDSAKELFSKPEIGALSIVMRAIDDPYHQGNIEAALNSIIFGINLDQVKKITKNGSIIDTCIGEKFVEWHELSLKTLNNGIIFEDILKYSKFPERLALLSESIMPYERVRGVVDYLTSVSVTEKLPWSDLIARISEIRRGCIELSDNEINVSHPGARVELLTVHKSKGLQADAVFVLPFESSKFDGHNNKYGHYHVHNSESGCPRDYGIRKILPQSMYNDDSAASKAAIAEYSREVARLLYVALTRASMRLYIIINGKKDSSSWPIDKFFAIKSREESPKYCPKDDNSCIENKFYSMLAGIRLELDTQHDRHDVVNDDEAQLKIIQELSQQIDAYREAKDDHDDETVDYGGRARSVVSYTSVSKRVDANEAEDIWKGHGERPKETVWKLSKGKNTGLFLHSLFELIPFDSIVEYKVDGSQKKIKAFSSWGKEPQIKDIFRRREEHYCISDDDSMIKRLVYTTLKHRFIPHNVAACKFKLPERLCDIRKSDNACELDFVCRACDVEQSNFFSGFFDDRSSIQGQLANIINDRSFIKGTYDVLFRVRDDKGWVVYLIDWKSDTLEAYDEATMREHIKHHYAIQVAFYSHAVKNDLLRLNRHWSDENARYIYGGMIYLFLRGINPDDDVSDGMYFIPDMS